MSREFLTPVALNADPSADTHATRRGWVNAQLAGKVDTTRSVLAGTGLTGGGALDADRTLAIAYGSASGTAVQGNDARVTADQAAGTASIRTLGTGALQATAGNDSRLSDARTPTAHASSHATGGGDALTPTAIGAMPRLTPTATKTTTYTASSGELVMADTTSGAFTITLPAAAAGAVVGVKKIVTASGTLTVQRAGSDTIGGAAATSVQLKLPDETMIFVANGTNWVVYDNYMPLPSLDGRYVRSDGASTAAGGSLAGFYPNPTIAAGAITGTEIAAAIKDPAAATAGLRTLGTGAAQAAAGDDSRFTSAVAYSRLPVGTAASTVAAGDDSRITGAVPGTRTITAGTGLTGGGDLTANRTLTVAYGTTSTTACVGNDSRLSDARTPTSHVHAGADISSGTVDNARLPGVLSPVRTVNPSSGSISINADTAGNNVDSTGSSATTLNVPTNGAPGQVIQGSVYASTGFTLTFHASFGRLSPVASTLVIPTGKVARYAIRRTDVTGSAKWLVEAAGVEA